VMVTGCLCVCGVLDDVSMSAITALADVIISGKLVATDVPAVVMALFVILCQQLSWLCLWYCACSCHGSVCGTVPAVVMALFVVLCLHLPNVTQWLTL